MKKKILLATAAVTAAMLIACGTDTNNEQTEEATTQEAFSDTLTTADLAVIINDTTVEIGADVNDYLDALGEPDDYSYAQSCTGAGEDKVYTYGSAYIYTNPVDGEDIIYLIELEGEETTARGIHVGSTLDELTTAYGDNYTDDGAEYLYTVDTTTIGFQLSNDEVTFIEVYGE